MSYNKPKTPIEIMFDKIDMICTNCNAKAGACDCWTKCPVNGCTWYIEKGHKCGNPQHNNKNNLSNGK